jgi:hypothetical protein
VQWVSGRSIPNDGRFALVGDTERSNILGANVTHDCLSDLTDSPPDFTRVMFYPTWLRKELLQRPCC